MAHSHWVCWPSAKPEMGVACARKWMAKGYSVAMLLDWGAWLDADLLGLPVGAGFHFWTHAEPRFPGYYGVINGIVAKAFRRGADLVTCIGDDMDPPEQGAEAVAGLYFSRFPDGFGVLQGTGDPQGKDAQGVPAAARICGSPTFGRGWNDRAYGGRGPFWPEYRSFYGDEEMWNVAKRAGVLWLEPSITIFHNHWSFGHAELKPYQKNNQGNWEHDKAVFERRVGESKQGAHWPGWEIASA